MLRKLVRRYFRLVSLYPPFVGAGIRVTRADPDFRVIEVAMPLTWWNRNWVGTQFGGSLFAMADPWFMIQLMERLGPDYVVWDKAGAVRFKRPGRGRVTARFEIDEAVIAQIRAQVASEGRAAPVLTVQIRDEQGEVVAEVDKTISVRPKPAGRPPGA